MKSAPNKFYALNLFFFFLYLISFSSPLFIIRLYQKGKTFSNEYKYKNSNIYTRNIYYLTYLQISSMLADYLGKVSSFV